MARYDHRTVQRGRFAIETTFGTDLTSDVATNFFGLRHKPFKIMRQTQMAQDETVVQRFFQQRNDVLGPDRGSASIEAYWTSSAESLTSGTTPTKTSQSKLFEALMGGYHADEGSTVAASPSPTTTSFSVAPGEGSNFAEGTLLGVTISGVVYPRLVTSVSTDALTVWPALPSAPSAAAVVLNSQSNYYDETGDKFIQILSEAAIDRGDIWLLRGAQGDLSMSLDRGGLVTWSSTLNGAVYDHDDEITTPQGGGAIAVETYADSAPIWGTLGGVHFGPTGSTTLSMVRCQSIAVTFGLSRIEIGDHAGTEGIGEWELGRERKTIELTLMRDSSAGSYEAWHDAFKAETDYGLLYWLGSTGGSIRSLCAPTCQIAAPPEAVEVNGLEAQKITLLVKENDRSSAQTTTVQRSPIVLAQI